MDTFGNILYYINKQRISFLLKSVQLSTWNVVDVIQEYYYLLFSRKPFQTNSPKTRLNKYHLYLYETVRMRLLWCIINSPTRLSDRYERGTRGLVLLPAWLKFSCFTSQCQDSSSNKALVALISPFLFREQWSIRELLKGFKPYMSVSP